MWGASSQVSRQHISSSLSPVLPLSSSYFEKTTFFLTRISCYLPFSCFKEPLIFSGEPRLGTHTHTHAHTRNNVISREITHSQTHPNKDGFLPRQKS